MNVIGRLDRIDLPELDIFDIEAKIDTGAYGCALHCHHINLQTIDGEEVLKFKVLDPSNDKYNSTTFESRKFIIKNVKSSSGELEERYAIKTELIIFSEKYLITFSLTDRESMKNPILLGRQFLSKRFIVDVTKKDLSYKLKTK